MIEHLMNECVKLHVVLTNTGSALRLAFEHTNKSKPFDLSIGSYGARGTNIEDALQELKRKLVARLEQQMEDRQSNLKKCVEQIQEMEITLNEVGATNVEAQRP